MFTGKKKAACAAMLSLAMVAPLAAFAENETRVITCGTLNLRAEESASSAILGKYGWGTEVLVKGVNGDWANVAGGLRRERNPRHHLRHAESARRG